MFIYAHRGSSGLFPENTMAAFMAAVEEGADGIETDLHLTADGVVVLVHDPEIKRQDGVRLKVSESTFSELRAAAGGNLATLDGLMAFAAGKTALNLEIKDPAVLPHIGRHLEKGRNILVTSFDRALMLTVAEKFPRVAAGVVLDVFGPEERQYLRTAGLGSVSLSAEVFGREAVRFCRRLGLKVNVWVANDPVMALEFHKAGADGVFTDRPGVLCRALGISDAAEEAGFLHGEVALHADTARAVAEKRYLKSERKHLGVAVPVMRGIVRKYLAGKPAARTKGLKALAEALWTRGFHEDRVLAAMLLNEGSALLGPGDMAFLEIFLRESGTWALIDSLSTGAVSDLCERWPAETGPVLDRWSEDGDFWMRRASLLALLGPIRAGGGDFGRFGRYADKMLDEKEFFIRKAIGWVLREAGRRRPALVAGWLAEREGRASRLTLREAVKYLSPEDRMRLMGGG